MAPLPLYARPLFLRMQARIDATSTFKQRKFNLVREGFDPAAIEEPLYFDDPRSERYVPLTAGLYRADRQRAAAGVTGVPVAALGSG